MRFDALFAEIIGLIDAKAMKNYLLENRDKLMMEQYRDIIVGAPVALTRKLELLTRLAAETGDEAVKGYLEPLRDAVDSLSNVASGKSVLLVEEVYPDYPEGAYVFPVATCAAARKAIAAYNAEWQEGGEDAPMAWYWKLRLYRLLPDGTFHHDYTYVCARDGEPQYFRRRDRDTLVGRHFGAPIPELNLPVPYRPGDILSVDCQPYTRSAYCLILEVGDDCCGVQCLFRDKAGCLRTGAFKHGHYLEGAYDKRQYLSPLYRAEPYTGPLPEEYAYLEPISQRLKKDPDYGKALWEKINKGGQTSWK